MGVIVEIYIYEVLSLKLGVKQTNFIVGQFCKQDQKNMC